jgi:DNA-binding MarR family transcriptional regulator
MENSTNPVAQRLLESFVRFRRLHWAHSPVHELTHSEVMVLSIIRKHGEAAADGIRVSDISNVLRVASPTITQQINSLEARGYVERRMDKEDRRAVRVLLTEKGEAAVKIAWDSFLDSFNGLAEYLGEEDSDELARLLAKVFQYFKERTVGVTNSPHNGVDEV